MTKRADVDQAANGVAPTGWRWDAVERAPSAWRIAVIGWGSLLWDPDGVQKWAVCDGAGAVQWRMQAGPRLPLEFSRVSRKRRGALTLVIDEDNGALFETHIAEHAAAGTVPTLEQAVAMAADDLAAREHAPRARIGVAMTGLSRGDLPGAAQVSQWLATSAFDGAVWTALEPTFERETGAAFSVDAAIAYLGGLDGDVRRTAVEYIEAAPENIDTPLRRALRRTATWRRLAHAQKRRLTLS